MDFYFRKDPSVYTDPADRSFKVTLEIGIIDLQYKRETFFNWPDQGVIGLAPTVQSESDSGLLSRQFLY